MTRILFSLFACMLFTTTAKACLNTYDEEIWARMQKGDTNSNAKDLARLEGEFSKSPSVEVTNDLAVAHVLAGNYKKAVELLQSLETKHPGFPKTASNLGTALELSGNNVEALIWIKEGIKRDPKDHEGTEWLHVKILEAKLAIAKDPAWLASDTVLGTGFGRKQYPWPESSVTDHLGQERSMAEAATAIRYQLHERLKFVSIPDPLIGDLYFSLANIEALPKEQSPVDYYDAALKFGAMNESQIKARSAWYTSNHPDPFWEDVFHFGVWGVSSAFLVVTIVSSIFFYRRGRAKGRVQA